MRRESRIGEELLKRHEHLVSDNPRHPIYRYGIECYAGWLPLVERCFKILSDAHDRGVRGTVVQIKQKVGALCFYVDPDPNDPEAGGDEFNKMLDDICQIEKESRLVCEECGKRESNVRASCFISSFCRECLEKLHPGRFTDI